MYKINIISPFVKSKESSVASSPMKYGPTVFRIWKRRNCSVIPTPAPYDHINTTYLARHSVIQSQFKWHFNPKWTTGSIHRCINGAGQRLLRILPALGMDKKQISRVNPPWRRYKRHRFYWIHARKFLRDVWHAIKHNCRLTSKRVGNAMDEALNRGEERKLSQVGGMRARKQVSMYREAKLIEEQEDWACIMKTAKKTTPIEVENADTC